MELRNLKGVTIPDLAECLNLSFADYVVPLYVSSVTLARKMRRENIQPEWSVGLFDGKKLVGFILTGLGQKEGQKALYNGGTGILPEYRGNGYAQAMHQALFNRARREGFQAIWLEVIDKNERALNLYRQLGFAAVREVDCFHGEVTGQKEIPAWPHLRIEEIREPIWKELASFFDCPPTWQNDLPALQNDMHASIAVTVRQEQQYLGYLIYSPYNLRLSTLAVHPLYRQRGIGKVLLQHLPPGAWSTINIDRRNQSALAFFQKMGWQTMFSQWEMKWTAPA